MATIIPAQITEDARAFWPQMRGGLLTNKIISSFRVGIGGWIDPGTGKEPRDPVASLRRLDNSLQDIDVIVDPTRAALDQRYAPLPATPYFTKALTVSDMSFVSPNKLEVRCYLDLGDYNDDGSGGSPEIWEIGIFSEHPVIGGALLMVAYGTFPQQTKTAADPILNIVRLVY